MAADDEVEDGAAEEDDTEDDDAVDSGAENSTGEDSVAEGKIVEGGSSESEGRVRDSRGSGDVGGMTEAMMLESRDAEVTTIGWMVAEGTCDNTSATENFSLVTMIFGLICMDLLRIKTM